MLGDVLRGQFADEVAVGFDHDAMLVEMADGPARPVIHIDECVVSPADHPITNRQLPTPVHALLAEDSLVAAQLACGLVERGAGVVVASDHDCLLDTNLTDRAGPLGDRDLARANCVVEGVDPSGAHCPVEITVRDTVVQCR